MPNIFLISDEHYNHSPIINYCGRPFPDTKVMREILIKNHNEYVSEDDIVYHLGDFALSSSWQDMSNILKKLKGKHILILGNHDHNKIWDYVEAGFQSVHTSFMLEDYLLVHDPAPACGGIKTIHGHLHNIGPKIAENTYSVCVELHNYTPVNFDDIKTNFI